MQINSNATYDVLSIAINLNKYNSDFNSSEINLFCYFSCLLSLYRGIPTYNWGYGFIKNELGVPISAEVQVAIKQALDLGHLIEESGTGYYIISDKGIEFYNKLCVISRYKERQYFIDNACSSLLTNSIGNIRCVLHTDPVISSVKESSLRTLFDDDSGATELLYSQFSILKRVLNCELKDELFIVVLTWIKCLQNIEGFGYANK